MGTVDTVTKDVAPVSQRILIRYECDQCERTTFQFQDVAVYCNQVAQHRRKSMRLMNPATQAGVILSEKEKE